MNLRRKTIVMNSLICARAPTHNVTVYTLTVNKYFLTSIFTPYYSNSGLLFKIEIRLYTINNKKKYQACNYL